MSRVFYVAHPVAGAVDANVMAAMRWYAWLVEREPLITFAMPWVVDVMTGNDADPHRREKGLLDCERIVARCDGIVLCGGRISSGMRRELDVARKHNLLIADLTTLDAEPDRDIAGLLSPLEFGLAMWRAKTLRPAEAVP